MLRHKMNVELLINTNASNKNCSRSYIFSHPEGGNIYK